MFFIVPIATFSSFNNLSNLFSRDSISDTTVVEVVVVGGDFDTLLRLLLFLFSFLVWLKGELLLVFDWDKFFKFTGEGVNPINNINILYFIFFKAYTYLNFQY